MSHPNKSKDKKIVINPYVTGRGGVVILNGPFPLKMANKVGALCAAAPDLLEALKMMYSHFGTLEDNHMVNQDCVKACIAARSAIARAEGK